MADSKIPPSQFVVNRKLNDLNKLTGGLGTLRLLFQEILQQIPPEKAEELAEGYRRGENIVIVIGESSYGQDKKTAFGYTLTKSQNWRGDEIKQFIASLEIEMRGPEQ